MLVKDKKKDHVKVRGNIWSVEVAGSQGPVSPIQSAEAGVTAGWRGETGPGCRDLPR